MNRRIKKKREEYNLACSLMEELTSVRPHSLSELRWSRQWLKQNIHRRYIQKKLNDIKRHIKYGEIINEEL